MRPLSLGAAVASLPASGWARTAFVNPATAALPIADAAKNSRLFMNPPRFTAFAALPHLPLSRHRPLTNTGV
jgi:hypothetical protein